MNTNVTINVYLLAAICIIASAGACIIVYIIRKAWQDVAAEQKEVSYYKQCPDCVGERFRNEVHWCNTCNGSGLVYVKMPGWYSREYNNQQNKQNGSASTKA